MDSDSDSGNALQHFIEGRRRSTKLRSESEVQVEAAEPRNREDRRLQSICCEDDAQIRGKTRQAGHRLGSVQVIEVQMPGRGAAFSNTPSQVCLGTPRELADA